ncbi:MAG: hypothetical protein IPM82_16540 [Saprospiraceae bacterium]|nr:hypothetical protein [Saprospiraceae bacterium]
MNHFFKTLAIIALALFSVKNCRPNLYQNRTHPGSKVNFNLASCPAVLSRWAVKWAHERTATTPSQARQLLDRHNGGRL